MFTGLIEETGIVSKVLSEENGKRFTIKARHVLTDAHLGDSICVNGACQTIEKFTPDEFTIFSIPETLAVTNFSGFREGTVVNLERALQLNARIGGHLVLGHVEATAEVIEISESEQGFNIHLSYESPYIIPKGSVTLDGISLTVMQASDQKFRVQIIPETLQKTNIKTWVVGYRPNIETDFIVKSLDHAERWRLRQSK